MGIISQISGFGCKIAGKRTTLLLTAVAGLACLASTPATANADFRIGIDIRDYDRPRGPVYQERETRVWVEPVYRTVADRVWVEPEYRTERVRVWVPARYEDHEVVRYNCGRRYIERVRVQVEPAHYEYQSRRVEVACGHWQTVERQELVCAGHWETRVERVAVRHPYDRHAHHERYDRRDNRVSLQFGSR